MSLDGQVVQSNGDLTGEEGVRVGQIVMSVLQDVHGISQSAPIGEEIVRTDGKQN